MMNLDFDIFSLTYPLTAPAERPASMYFCANMKNRITGINMIQLAAHIGPQSVPKLCTKAVTPSGSVLREDEESSTLDQSISPHQPRKRNMAFVAVAGSIMGMTTRVNVDASLQPSILDASIISTGTLEKKFR